MKQKILNTLNRLFKCKDKSVLNQQHTTKSVNNTGISYTYDFNKLDVFYNGEHIGHVKREAGYRNYYMYYNYPITDEQLAEDINKAKEKLEKIVKCWEFIIKNQNK